MDFVDFITGLAPEGETALFVRQKPKLTGEGQYRYHADGALMASWPAFLPGRQKPGQAWYGNTGSFIIDRFIEGKPSASAACCEYVLLMVLDDVGDPEKAPKTPPLPPTWIMETSEGSFQWGYVFSEQPAKAEYAAAIRAIADAGYSDPGAVNPVRNFRLPGSVNLKPHKNLFESKLVAFNPEREYSLTEICQAFGVTPAAADSTTVRSIRLSDDGADDVLAWLSDKGMVLTPPNSEGWAGIVCPNSVEHTDGNPEGRYLPLTRAYCCYHGHCEGWDSARFLSWVADEGGPRHVPGLREELLTAHMQSSLAKLTPTDAYPDAAAQVIAEVERREAGRLEMADWWSRWAYVVRGDGYFDLSERREVARGVFNALYRHIKCLSIHDGAKGTKRRVEASIAFDEHRQAMGARVLEGLAYAAGDDVLVSRDGAVFGNRWRDARPKVTYGGDVSRWLAHAEKMIPDAAERAHVFDIMAFKLQHPKVKINHGVLHAGTPGAGKDTLWAPFFYAIGGVGGANVKLVKNDEILSQWGYALESEVLVLNELRQTEAADRRAVENFLKPLLAAPPELLSVNRKGLHPYDAANRLLVVAFSNERAAITLPSDDRRWFVLWTTAPVMDKVEADAFWHWYKAGGGFDAVTAWLWARDVSSFKPGASPPMTDAKLALLSAGMPALEAAIVDLIERRQADFACGVVGGAWQSLAGRLSAHAGLSVRISVPTLLHALREAGWIDLGLVHTRDYKTKRHMYCRPDMATLTRTELRAILETSGAGAGNVSMLRAVG